MPRNPANAQSSDAGDTEGVPDTQRETSNVLHFFRLLVARSDAARVTAPASYVVLDTEVAATADKNVPRKQNVT